MEYIKEEEVEGILEKAMKRVMDESSCICGFIPDKNIQNNQSYQINEEYLVEIREERMVKMLQKEVKYHYHYLVSRKGT